VWLDVIDVACSYTSTLDCTLPAERFFNEPVPSDRLPNRGLTPWTPERLHSACGL